MGKKHMELKSQKISLPADLRTRKRMQIIGDTSSKSSAFKKIGGKAGSDKKEVNEHTSY
jgi:hypothetical protein